MDKNTIWVDADACPVPIKNILLKAAQKNQIQITFVANQFLTLPKSPFIKMLQVAKGFDVADNEIVKKIQQQDLVITADIPLAADVINKGGLALSPRGELYTHDNIKARLSMRNFMADLRDSGVETGGSSPFNHSDRQQFANQLDRWLHQVQH